MWFFDKKTASKEEDKYYKKLEKKYKTIPRLDEISREAIIYVGISPKTLSSIQNRSISPAMFDSIYNYLSINSSMHKQEAQAYHAWMAITISIIVFMYSILTGIFPTLHQERHLIIYFIITIIFSTIVATTLYLLFCEASKESDLARLYARSQDWIAKEYGIILPWDYRESVKRSKETSLKQV